MQTALIYSSHATHSVIGVAMVASFAPVGMRLAWANSKHPR
ncbi:MAG: hypothetical protein ABIZ64_17280 [Casimicrobium sp.]